MDWVIRLGIMAVAVVVGGLAAALFTAPIIRRRSRSMQASGRIEGGLRVLDGRFPGLTRRWRHGHAFVAPGQLTFTAYVGGLRLFRRPAVTIPVTMVEPDSARGTGIRDGWAAPGLAVRLQSGDTRLEWGVFPAERLDWALQELGLGSAAASATEH